MSSSNKLYKEIPVLRSIIHPRLSALLVLSQVLGAEDQCCSHGGSCSLLPILLADLTLNLSPAL